MISTHSHPKPPLSQKTKVLLKLGENYKGFKVEKIDWISAFKSKVFQLSHQKSGAKVTFISNHDSNKAFSIAFKTPPYDDTGVFHTFEHSVLAGSKKYPSKSLFFSLYASSLASNLNASTHPVFTQYYYASKLEKDFFNLLNAYLDAVFYPNVVKNPNIVKREGWRIEWNEESKTFKYNGIVFSEMKGVFAEPFVHLYRSVIKSLLPQTPYAFNSGGDPEKIIELRFDQIQEAHKKYYHPDNSMIYLYGDLNIKKTLSSIHNVLSHFHKRKNVKPLEIRTQKTFNTNSILKSTYPVLDKKSLKGKTFINLNYVLGKKISLNDLLSIEILGSTLFDEEDSPGKQLIRTSRLAKDISFDAFGTQENIVSISLEGVSSIEEQKKIKIQIEKMLKEISEKNLPQKNIESTLNTKEFSLKEALFNSPHKGLGLRSYVFDHWIEKNHELKNQLEFIERFSQVRKKLKNQIYVQSLIKKFFVENKKKSLVTLSPDPKFINKLEKKLSLKMKNALKKEDPLKLKKEGQVFKKWQIALEPKSILSKTPHLNPDVLSFETEKINYTLTTHKYKGSKKIKNTFPQSLAKMYSFPQNTGGINYVDLHFSLSHIKETNLYDLPITLYLLKKINTKKRAFGELTHVLNENLGDLSFYIETFTPLMNRAHRNKNQKAFKPHLIVSFRFLNEKSNTAFELTQEVLTQSLFEPEDQVRSLILELINDKKTSIIDRASSLASLSGEAFFSDASKWMTYIHGHMAEKALRKIEKEISNDKTKIKKISKKIKKTFSLLFNKNNFQLALLVGEKENLKTLKQLTKHLTSQLNESLKKEAPPFFQFKKTNPFFKTYTPIDGFEIPSQVQYNHMKIPYFKLNKKLNGKIYVFSRILIFEYLFKVLREQNGAYGTNAKLSSNGILSLSSYRDPKLKNTFEIFKSFTQFLDSLSLNKKQLAPFIIGALSPYYSPKSPYDQARSFMDRKLIHMSENDHQRLKKEILSTRPKDIKRINEEIKKIISKAKKTVAGRKEKIEKEAPFIKNKMTL